MGLEDKNLNVKGISRMQIIWKWQDLQHSAPLTHAKKSATELKLNSKNVKRNFEC